MAVGGRFQIQAVVLAGIHADAALLVGIPVLPAGQRESFALDGDHLFDRQPVLLGELEIAFVVRRHAHHRAVAVAHQHVVADPDLDLFAGQRMVDEYPRRHALLFHGRHVGFHHRAVLAFVDEGGELRVALRGMGRQRMLGGDGAEGHAHDGVGAGGEHPEFFLLAVEFVGKGEAHAGALADPVGLHGLDPLGPARQGVERAEQFVGVLGDGEVVAGNFALLDHRAGAPAAAFDHLLVGQHGLVHRVPVHHLGLLVGDALFQHAQEQPLVPLVILGRAGGQLALPVEGKAQRFATASSCRRCCPRSTSPAAPCSASRRSRRAGRRHPSPWAAGRCSPSCGGSGRAHRRWYSSARAPCAACPTGRGTSTGSSTSAWLESARARKVCVVFQWACAACSMSVGRYFSCMAGACLLSAGEGRDYNRPP